MGLAGRISERAHKGAGAKPPGRHPTALQEGGVLHLKTPCMCVPKQYETLKRQFGFLLVSREKPAFGGGVLFCDTPKHQGSKRLREVRGVLPEIGKLVLPESSVQWVQTGNPLLEHLSQGPAKARPTTESQIKGEGTFCSRSQRVMQQCMYIYIYTYNIIV